ncbi:MAG: hypothetical protein ACYDDN_03805 [Candidatus Desulforudaceae bacterium]
MKSERQILGQEGQKVSLGSQTIEVKPLVWDDCNKFEDAVLQAVAGVAGIQSIDTKGESAEQLIVQGIQRLVRDELAAIAMAAVPGLTMDDIRQGTKAEVIGICVTAFTVNYGYVKNVLDLAASIRR